MSNPSGRSRGRGPKNLNSQNQEMPKIESKDNPVEDLDQEFESLSLEKIDESTSAENLSTASNNTNEGLDATVTKKTEDDTVVKKIEEQQVESSNLEIVRKPEKMGDLGREIMLRVNHYALTIKNPFTVFQYDIELTKKEKNKKFNNKNQNKSKITKETLREMFLKFTNDLPSDYDNKIIYNFCKNLYSLKKLPFKEMERDYIKIGGSYYTLRIKETKTSNQIRIDPTDCDDPVSIQVFDLIITHNFNYKFTNVKRSFFKEGHDFQKLGFGLELWRGAYSSVRPSEIGLTWNVDSVNCAFLTSENVLECCSKFYGCDYNDLSSKIKNDIDSRDKNTIGFKFLELYNGRAIKTATTGSKKRIQGFGPNANFTFEYLVDNKKVKMSIAGYIKQYYKKETKYPDLPCIDLGNKAYLPMEFCRTELKNKNKLTETEKHEISMKTAIKAPDRMACIESWRLNSEIDKDPILKEYNLDICVKLIDVKGRVLDAPDIKYGLTNVAQSSVISDKGSWNHNNFRLVNCVNVSRWVVLNFSSRVRDSSAYKFCLELSRIGQLHGVSFAKPLDYAEPRNVRYAKAEDAKRLLEDIITKHNQLDLIIIIMSGTTKIYNMLKTCGDINFGIPSQGVKDINVNMINEHVLSNLIMKINTKLGGRNWYLSHQNNLFAKYLEQLYQGPLMVFGADVTHPSPVDLSMTESLAAVTGSLDKEACFYAARLYAQKTPKSQAYEMIHDLDKMVVNLLHENFQKNKTFPKKIVFYRDGVSDGQFPIVLRHEMNKIRSACQQIATAYKPAITFIVVQKRHHTRFFPVKQKDKNGRAENVPPGTVVDRTIVSKSLFDFFLCSHVGVQGTSRPCRYYVLHDDNNFSMNQAQLLSHYLCHLYARCPRSVSYPAPCYYAHLAAFRARDYIRVPQLNENMITSYEIELHPRIRNKMFFI